MTDDELDRAAAPPGSLWEGEPLGPPLRAVTDAAALAKMQLHGFDAAVDRVLGPTPSPLETDVTEFQRRFGFDVDREPTPVLVDLRRRLVKEEANELRAALAYLSIVADENTWRDEDVAQVAGECADLIYVAVGTLVALGIPLGPVWDEVHRANMEKVPGGEKPRKPVGWRAPELLRAIRGQTRPGAWRNRLGPGDSQTDGVASGDPGAV